MTKWIVLVLAVSTTSWAENTVGVSKQGKISEVVCSVTLKIDRLKGDPKDESAENHLGADSTVDVLVQEIIIRSEVTSDEKASKKEEIFLKILVNAKVSETVKWDQFLVRDYVKGSVTELQNSLENCRRNQEIAAAVGNFNQRISSGQSGSETYSSGGLTGQKGQKCLLRCNTAAPRHHPKNSSKSAAGR